MRSDTFAPERGVRVPDARQSLIAPLPRSRAWPDVALSRSGDWTYNHPGLAGDPVRSELLSEQFPWMTGGVSEELNGRRKPLWVSGFG